MQEFHQTREYLHLKPQNFKNEKYSNPTQLPTRKVLRDILLQEPTIE